MMPIIIVDHLAQPLLRVLVVFHFTYSLARLVDFHLQLIRFRKFRMPRNLVIYLVRRCVNFSSVQNLPHVCRMHFHYISLAKGHVVVAEWELRFHRRELVHEQLHLFPTHNRLARVVKQAVQYLVSTFKLFRRNTR